MLDSYHIKINVKEKADKVKIVCLSDIHFGHEDCRVDMLDKYIDYIKQKKAYWFINGDLIEMAIHSHMGFTMWSQKMNPEKQVAEIIRKFEPIKDRCLFIAEGNHEARSSKATSIRPSKIIAEALQTLHVGIGGYIVFEIGKQKYVCGVQHGSSGGAANPKSEFQKMQKVYGDAEILILSHNHQLYDLSDVTFELDEDGKPRRRQILFVRTGTFLDYAEYSQEKMYAPGIVGAAILTLGVSEHTKRADTSATLSREE